MLVTTRMLEDRLSTYENPRNKIGRMVSADELVPVRRGLYETDRTIPGYFLAPCIYGPSYLSFEYALGRHGLIPEAVHTYTSATCGKRKTRRYKNAFGHYNYQDVPLAVFPLFVDLKREGNYAYWLASPEKALCDELYKLPPTTSHRTLERLLLDDLRIDEEGLRALDSSVVSRLAERYHSRSVSHLASYLEGVRR